MLTQGNSITTFNVISPELPAGSAWLANCMIELGVAVWNPWDVVIPNEWQQLSNTLYRYNDSNKNWQQTLPSLTYGHIYNFDQPHAATFCHRWPHTVSKNQPTVLFFRDPRDLLHSQWRRVKHNNDDHTLSLNDFIHSRFHHFPLSQQEYLLLFMNLWVSYVKKNDGLIIRFEDYRHDPASTLSKVTEFLNMSVSNAQHEHAINFSDYQVCRQAEDQLAELGKLKNKFNF